MKGMIVISLACFLLVFALVGCQRDRGVQAGNDNVYQPRAAPTNGELKGELLQVDATGKSIGVRVENGMVQTFQCDNDTAVAGLPNQPAIAKKPASAGKI